ncbi:hypothetical protein Taro_018039 [Colocasia esculenta]|uniref:Neprosin PEP catalytic domain-containing protein n=1 Tax=Colocasia esculenta TaxID=4460 RepID=A0A843V185_COLES|nr:hypothetical protein [Colocasia esculenta]
MGLRQPWTAEEGGFYIPSPHYDLVDAAARRGRRQPRPCLQIQTAPDAEGRRRRHQNSLAMASSRRRASPIIAAFVGFLLLASIAAAMSLPASNATFHPREELTKLRRVRAHLRRLNKPSVRTIQSPEGDVIDCVPSHLQPAFDHPLLKGQMPMEPPERPSGLPPVDPIMAVSFQSWAMTGLSCPEGTVPIRRTTEADVLRASSIGRFGRKPMARVRRDSTSSGHEHAVGYVMGDQFYGAKASLNVWSPVVSSPSEFSLSQIWVIAGSFGDDLNTIEAGWQVSPELYGDSNPRFFTYWTTDAYQATGCYNLLCSGFVQTNNKIAIGAAISPISTYKGGQFDISILVWKDPKHGNWWLEFGSGMLVGYWPSFLFSHLAQHASMVQFGGEVVNNRAAGVHTGTQMGSGHFAGEGFGRASYFRNLQVVDWDNSLVPPAGLRVLADHPNCYDIQGGVNSVWGSYFYYGGPGRNVRCSD